jgi:hypothetical protein
MTADAPWCTLCLTPRPASAPVPAAVAASTAAHYPAVTRPPAPGAPAPVGDTAPAAEPAAARTWPCHRCHEAIPLDLDICPACGAAFLGGSGELPVLSLPLVGDLTGRSTAATYAIAAGIGIGLALLAVSAVAVIGLIF